MFYSDKPIISNEEDQLGRGGFAKQIAQALIDLNSTDTFSVGLYGKWGSGKTSLVNMMLNEIDEQQKSICEGNQFIVVHFEPWHFQTLINFCHNSLFGYPMSFVAKGIKIYQKLGRRLKHILMRLTLQKLFPLWVEF